MRNGECEMGNAEWGRRLRRLKIGSARRADPTLGGTTVVNRRYRFGRAAFCVVRGHLVREGGEGGESVCVAAGGEGKVGGLGDLYGDAVEVGVSGVVGGGGELGAADDIIR